MGHWKHGGIVGVKGYGGGVIGRYTDMPEEFPNISEFHTVRVAQPSGWFYTSDTLREICDVWEERAAGSRTCTPTGDIILLGTHTDQLQPIFDDISDRGFDLGGSGSDLRSPSCCVGPGRCEHACYDTLDMCYDLTNEYQDEIHRPMWPYKFKFKMSGCANDCVAAQARADCSIIGTWRDSIIIDQDEVKKYAADGLDIQMDVCHRCPSHCLTYDKDTQELSVNAEECTRCMHCINVMGKAIKQGKEKGATIMIGAKSTIVKSAFGVVGHRALHEDGAALHRVQGDDGPHLDWWDENGKTRERIGELIYRLGMGEFLRATGIPAVPQMVYRPRANPYVFWQKDEIED